MLAAIDHESQEGICFCDPDGNMLDAREIFRRGRKDRDKVIVFAREAVV